MSNNFTNFDFNVSRNGEELSIRIVPEAYTPAIYNGSRWEGASAEFTATLNGATYIHLTFAECENIVRLIGDDVSDHFISEDADDRLGYSNWD